VPADGETPLAPTVTCQLIDALVGRGSRGWTDRAPTDARISSSFAGVSAVIADTPAPTRTR
jgi:hypothetical protein